MSHQPHWIYEFGEYRLDPAERLLQRSGQAIPLQPKLFDLLLALVERAGHLIEKDELMKVVWPDTIVEEANLSNNISILRKTLQEDGQRFIETVPKWGYRFDAPVQKKAVKPWNESRPGLNPTQEPPDSGNQDPEAPPAADFLRTPARRRTDRRRWGVALILMLALLLLIGAIVFWLKRSPSVSATHLPQRLAFFHRGWLSLWTATDFVDNSSTGDNET